MIATASGDQNPSSDIVRSRRNIPSLDGIRAISIGLVILAHAQGTRGFPAWLPGVVVEHGTLGVQIFFVISGFLITTLLMEERASTGRISLKLFYARRTLRIFPPFYCFLAVVFIGTIAGIFSVNARNLWFAATYTMNYLERGGVWLTGHIWSLSVEEQFYLVWPLTIRLAGFNRGLRIAGGMALAAPLTCFLLYLINPLAGSAVTRYFPFVADSIAAGCFLAGAMPEIRRNAKIYGWLQKPAGVFVLPLIVLLDLGRPHPRIHLAFTETALNICICYAIARYTEFPRGPIGRFLNRSVIAFVGKLSYSLYLWQQVFMNRFESGIPETFPINVAASFACAAISWHLIEAPMAGIRRRFRPKTTQLSMTA